MSYPQFSPKFLVISYYLHLCTILSYSSWVNIPFFPYVFHPFPGMLAKSSSRPARSPWRVRAPGAPAPCWRPGLTDPSRRWRLEKPPVLPHICIYVYIIYIILYIMLYIILYYLISMSLQYDEYDKISYVRYDTWYTDMFWCVGVLFVYLIVCFGLTTSQYGMCKWTCSMWIHCIWIHNMDLQYEFTIWIYHVTSCHCHGLMNFPSWGAESAWLEVSECSLHT